MEPISSVNRAERIQKEKARNAQDQQQMVQQQRLAHAQNAANVAQQTAQQQQQQQQQQQHVVAVSAGANAGQRVAVQQQPVPQAVVVGISGPTTAGGAQQQVPMTGSPTCTFVSSVQSKTVTLTN